jgi:hypothetical protein
MHNLFADADVGRKNIAFGMTLFVLFGVILGVPLTVDLFGGSLLAPDQYQTWKVIHGYGVFLGFLNYFFGLTIDRVRLSAAHKEVASWSFLIAGLFGAFSRMALALLAALGEFGLYASLGETVFITIGTTVFVLGQMRPAVSRDRAAPQRATPGTTVGRPRMLS